MEKDLSNWDPDIPHEAFFIELSEYLEEYIFSIADNISNRTAHKYSAVINGMIDYVCVNHGAAGFEDLTVSMVNSKFLAWYNSHTHEGLQKITVKNILKGYFEFIYQTHGIRNSIILKSLSKK
jgi:hypothetical protein